MQMFLSIISLFLAFGALWFTSEVVKRTDQRGKLAVAPHIAPLVASLGQAEVHIRKLGKDLEHAEAEIARLGAELEQLERGSLTPPDAMNNVAAGMNAVAAPERVEWQHDRTFVPSTLYNA